MTKCWFGLSNLHFIGFAMDFMFHHRSCFFSFILGLFSNQQKILDEKNVLESVRQPCDHPKPHGCGENDPLLPKGDTLQEGIIQAINHAPITRSRFIHQTMVPVSLELKDTEVRAYRTDPVQVRSWLLDSTFGYKNIFACIYASDVGLCQ